MLPHEPFRCEREHGVGVIVQIIGGSDMDLPFGVQCCPCRECGLSVSGMLGDNGQHANNDCSDCGGDVGRDAGSGIDAAGDGRGAVVLMFKGGAFDSPARAG